MGQEAACTVRVGRKSHSGKALLETEHLLFRGDLRLDIPFDQMREVAVEGEFLVVKTADPEARFELGAATAERWARLIKEPKGLFEKLEIQPQLRIAVVDIHDTFFLTALRERVPGLAEGRVPQGAAIIFLGAETPDALRKIPLLRARMTETGALWVVRPKGSKAIAESDVLAALREATLIDVKVVAFSKTHTAHKAVIPAELRGQPIRRRPPVVSLPPGPPGDPSDLAAPDEKARKKTAPGKAR